jgi:hypothetical protein
MGRLLIPWSVLALAWLVFLGTQRFGVDFHLHDIYVVVPWYLEVIVPLLIAATGWIALRRAVAAQSTGASSPVRRRAAQIAFVAGSLFCLSWAAWAAGETYTFFATTSSGGIGSVSVASSELIYGVVPLLLTVILARMSDSARLARRWRNAHLLTTLAMVIAAMTGSSIVAALFVMSAWIPVQLFFVNGALAIWMSNPRGLVTRTLSTDGGSQ